MTEDMIAWFLSLEDYAQTRVVGSIKVWDRKVERTIDTKILTEFKNVYSTMLKLGIIKIASTDYDTGLSMTVLTTAGKEFYGWAKL